jgi:pyruvate dehydrogenase E1 component beta subunit
VPEEFYTIDIGRGDILKEGSDITIVGLSYILDDVIKTQKMLDDKGISAEIINLRSIKPIDIDIVLKSVEKTKNLVITDITWEYFNLASEISSRVTTELFKILKRPPLRITLPDAYVGASKYLEQEYYLDENKIFNKIMDWYKAV